MTDTDIIEATQAERLCAGCGKPLPKTGATVAFFSFGDAPPERCHQDDACIEKRKARVERIQKLSQAMEEMERALPADSFAWYFSRGKRSENEPLFGLGVTKAIHGITAGDDFLALVEHDCPLECVRIAISKVKESGAV